MNVLSSPPTAPQEILHWEDFAVGTRSSFGALTVSRESILAFAHEFDPQPFHLDDDAARQSIFGGLCASGWHTCAMAMRLMCDEVLLRSASLGSPGIDKLRWLKPVRPEDTLSLHTEVLASRPMASRPEVGLVQTRWELHNQLGEPVLQMEGWGMFRRRPAVT